MSSIANEELVVERVQVLSPRPGDTLLFSFVREMSFDECARAQDRLRERFPAQHVLVIGAECSVSIVDREAS